ncbi:MAG: hypothetical protein B7Z18_12190, partial [Alishewanella sp. 32-51-5]
MNKLLIAAATALTVASLPATADIRWNYIGAGYTDAAGDGPYIEGSVQIAPVWVLRADYSRQSVGRFDFNVIDVGVRYPSRRRPVTLTCCSGRNRMAWISAYCWMG